VVVKPCVLQELYVSDDPVDLVVVSEYLLVALEALEQVPVLPHYGVIVQKSHRGHQLRTLWLPCGRLGLRGGCLVGGGCEVWDVRQGGTLLRRY
jgi:hypothetical protein